MRQFRPRRVPTSLPVSIFPPPYQIPLKVRASNISTSGIFVKTLLDFDVGELLICKFSLPENIESCSFVSQVARSVRYDAHESTEPEIYMGLGLKFLGGPNTMRNQIRTFVDVMDISESETEYLWFH